MKILLTIAASLVVFAAVMLFNLPARWVSGLLPANISCGELSGTVWNGSCAPFAIQGLPPLGVLSWDLSPLSALTGRITGPATLANEQLQASADLALRWSGDGEISALKARLPLDPQLVPGLPPNTRGTTIVDVAKLVIAQGKLAELRGVIEARDLQDVGANAMSLGSYSLSFDGPVPDDGSLTGRLVDLVGPLAVGADLTVTAAPGYRIEGTVAVRPEAPDRLRRQLEILGPADAGGRRPFALEGTF